MYENDLSAEGGTTISLSLKTTDRRGAIAVIYNINISVYSLNFPMIKITYSNYK
jgi:hypothetical protein